MLVSSWSCSNSRSFRLRGEDRGARDEATDSARDVRPSMAGVAERPRDMRLGRAAGGRIEDVVRLAGGIPGRGRPDMAKSRVVFWVVWNLLLVMATRVYAAQQECDHCLLFTR
jgi:hypothetical protein